MKDRLLAKLRMPDGSINPWVIAVTATLATFMEVLDISGGASGPGAASQAHGMIYGTVERQAAMMAFIDNFHMLGIVFFVVIPVLLLLKRPPKGVNAPAH